MTPDEIREMAGELQEVVQWARDSYVDYPVSITHEYYEVDLGQFGTPSMEVQLEDENYQIDPAEIINHAPYDLNDIDNMADMLHTLAVDLEEKEEEPATLQSVIERMSESEDDDERLLAGVIGSILVLMEKNRGGAPLFAPPSFASVPEKLKPWPGALRTDIDYTAPDFPQKYDPPPGFMWSRGGSATTADPGAATRVSAGAEREMYLDNLGRVSWEERGDANVTDGERWLVWNEESRGIPSARGFSHGWPPRAIDADGSIIPEPNTEHTEYSDAGYNFPSNTEKAYEAVRQRRAELTDETRVTPAVPEFAPPASVSV